jgi:hypothetical protein
MEADESGDCESASVCPKPILMVHAINMLSSGVSALSDDRNVYAFTNLLDGIELFSSATLTHKCSIPQPLDHRYNIALGVRMVANTYLVVGGHGGMVWVYDQRTGKVVDQLQFPSSSGAVSNYLLICVL